MKSINFIESIRKDRQELWASHLLSLSTNGAQGMRCFTPDYLQSLLKQTDEEIVKAGLEAGVFIEDANEFLAEIEKQKRAK